MFSVECRSIEEHKRLFSRSSNASEIKIAPQFLSYPAQELGRGMFIYPLASFLTALSLSNSRIAVAFSRMRMS